MKRKNKNDILVKNRKKLGFSKSLQNGKKMMTRIENIKMTGMKKNIYIYIPYVA